MNFMKIMCLSKGLDAVTRCVPDTSSTLAFIPNAGDTYKDPYFVKESQARLELLGYQIKLVDLRQINSPQEFSSSVVGCAGVFVAGGNCFNLLNELRRSGAFEVLKDLVRNGLPYLGESAGAAILYSNLEPYAILDDSAVVPSLKSYQALNLVHFITLPHSNREKYASLFEEFRSRFRVEHRIVDIRDDQAIFTSDGISAEIVESAIRELGKV